MQLLKLLRVVPFCLLPFQGLPAVTVETDSIPNRSIFGIAFPGESRAFYAKADEVISLSKQDYVTAAFRVVEINLVTDGRALLRIYHSRPLKPGEALESASDAASAGGAPTSFRAPLPEGAQRMADKAAQVGEGLTGSTVIKEYPIATHAHTIEYRMRSRTELLALFSALEDHWLGKEKENADGAVAPFNGGEDAPAEDNGNDGKRSRLALGGTLFVVEN